MHDPWEILGFVAHTVALGGFLSVGWKLWRYRRGDGPLLQGLVHIFFGAGAFWLWIEFGYVERLFNFVPTVDVLDVVTRRFIALPIAVCIWWPLWRLWNLIGWKG